MTKLGWLIAIVMAACGGEPAHPVDAAVDTRMPDAKIPVCGDGVVDVGEQCDDHNQFPGDGCTMCHFDPGVLTASWTIQTLAGATQPCPATFDTAAVYSQALDTQGNPVGSPLIDLFDCAAGTGMTASIAGGPYAVHIEIVNHNNTTQYAASPLAKVTVMPTGATFNATILTDGGYFGFTWNLTKLSNGAPLTCADVAGINGVESLATVTSGTTGVSDIFNCADGSGITGSFLAGSYTISIDAVNGSMQSLGTAPTLTDKIIQAPNKVTNLGTITIPIDSL